MTNTPKQKEGVKVKLVGRDEVYCLWFKCEACKNEMIAESDNYCPNCGAKIIEKIYE